MDSSLSNIQKVDKYAYYNFQEEKRRFGKFTDPEERKAAIMNAARRWYQKHAIPICRMLRPNSTIEYLNKLIDSSWDAQPDSVKQIYIDEVLGRYPGIKAHVNPILHDLGVTLTREELAQTASAEVEHPSNAEDQHPSPVQHDSDEVEPRAVSLLSEAEEEELQLMNKNAIASILALQTEREYNGEL